MFCPACGASNPDDARFCAACAKPLAPAAGAAPAQPPVPPAQPPVTPPRDPYAGAQPAYQPPAAPPMDVSKIFFIPRMLEYISQGGLFRRIVATFLNVGAVISGIGWLVLAVLLTKGYFDFGGIAILGGLLAFPLALFAGYMVVHSLIVRARSIRELPQAEYTVIPIMSILLKLNGELGLIAGLAFGLQGMLLTWFLGQSPLSSFNPYGGYGYGYSSSPAEGFILGIVFLLGMVIYGFLALLVNYLFSELVVILADIAKDVRVMRNGKAA